MFPTEFDLEMRRQQFERDAAHQRLIRLAREDQPSLWQRLRIRLSAAQIVMPTSDTRESVTRTDVMAVSQ